ncbi:MAG TPA: PAS domain-containing protein [Anaerolineales bacterium]
MKRRLAETEAALKTLIKHSPSSDEPAVQADTADTTPAIERYRSLFDNMTEGFALQEIICDAQGIPCDFTFVELNPAFERMTGIKRQNAIGMLASQVLPGLEPFWIETCGQVALTGQPVQFDHYSHTLGKFYRVYAFCPVPGQFATIFMDITEAKQVELSRMIQDITVDNLTAQSE